MNILSTKNGKIGLITKKLVDKITQPRKFTQKNKSALGKGCNKKIKNRWIPEHIYNNNKHNGSWNSRKVDLWVTLVAILLIFPLRQISNITTRWHHQKAIKEREINVDNFNQNAVKNIYPAKSKKILLRMEIITEWVTVRQG